MLKYIYGDNMNYSIVLTNKYGDKQIMKYEYNGVYKESGPLEEIDNYLTKFNGRFSYLNYIYDNFNVYLKYNDLYIIRLEDNKVISPIYYNKEINKLSSEVINKDDSNYLLINDLYNRVSTIISDRDFYLAVMDSISISDSSKNILSNLYNKKTDQPLSMFIDYYTNNYCELRALFIFIDYYIKNHVIYRNELRAVARESLKKKKIMLKGLSNSQIDYYFNNGGLQEVLDNCDTNDILSLSDDELDYIGYKR